MNFKLRKTRIILLLSICWCGFSYFFMKGGLLLMFDRDGYYYGSSYGAYDFDLYVFLFLNIPVIIYWGIPLIRGLFTWVKNGE